MLRLLLDTHTFLWWVNDSPDLSTKARQVIASVNSNCFLSLASCWEMAIKSSLGKLKLTKPLDRFIAEQLAANGFNLLNIDLSHTTKIEKLPFHHRDPFDRLLIAQAMAEKLTIVSVDAVFPEYGVKVIW